MQMLETSMGKIDFQKEASVIAEWIAHYLKDSQTYPVLSKAQPEEIRKALPQRAPQTGESFDAIWHDFKEIILPGITHWNHPAFFAYFPNTGSAPGILGEFLCAALNVNGMLWKTSPAATELEVVVLDWLRQMLGFPEKLFGMILDTASVASLCAMAAARESLNLDIRKRGMTGRTDLPKLRIYASAQAHSSIDKGALLLGFGEEGVRKIQVDSQFRMDPKALDQAIREDLKSGVLPACVVATVGTTSTTSIDPVPAIAELCAKYRIWLHVDAAYAGVAGIIPEMRGILAGCEHADSFVTNPHKWLFVPVDCTAFYTRKPEILKKTFSLIPDYLKTEEEAVPNFMDYGIQLGRRFRALKLWMVIRSFGQEGLISALRNHMALAQEFASWIDQDMNFERLAPVPFSTVCFRACPKDFSLSKLNRLNQDLLAAVNATGKIFLSHTKLGDVFALRLAVANLGTKREHLKTAFEILKEQISSLLAIRIS